MRVGTDAVLLGAWAGKGAIAPFSGGRILDVGCGCGLIALMMAQRFASSRVLGVDIDAASVMEARENAVSSPFADRVDFCQADVRTFAQENSGMPYSLVVCNPPYFTEDTLPPEQRRSMARNSVHLTFAELLQSVSRILADDGRQNCFLLLHYFLSVLKLFLHLHASHLLLSLMNTTVLSDFGRAKLRGD